MSKETKYCKSLLGLCRMGYFGSSQRESIRSRIKNTAWMDLMMKLPKEPIKQTMLRPLGCLIASL